MENPPALVVRKDTLGGTVNCELILLHILYSGYSWVSRDVTYLSGGQL